jgi:hypothetical protein
VQTVVVRLHLPEFHVLTTTPDREAQVPAVVHGDVESITNEFMREAIAGEPTA